MLLSSVYFVVVIVLLGLCTSMQLSNYFLGGCELYSGSPSSPKSFEPSCISVCFVMLLHSITFSGSDNSF